VSRGRIAAVVVTLAVLVLLFGWQYALDRRVADCQASGGSWDGPSAQCIPNPAPPILDRGIRRTDNSRTPSRAR
jgi:hypothetical protein